MRIAASIAQIDNHCSVPHSVTYVGIELLQLAKLTGALREPFKNYLADFVR